MSRVETLNELSQLQSSGFGQPWPRHGLRLLHWFANTCVYFDRNNDMVSRCKPKARHFGFHRFENRCGRNGVLLPEEEFPYYVVGNLNSQGAEYLPDYIREDYTDEQDVSNMDRIIVSLNQKWFDKIYITAHSNESNYDADNTYRISKGLLQIINRMTLDDFLSEMGYKTQPMDNIHVYRNQMELKPTRNSGFLENCTIL